MTVVADYYHLNPRCNYCAGPVTVIRVTTGAGQPTDPPLVATLCAGCAGNESAAVTTQKTGVVRTPPPPG